MKIIIAIFSLLIISPVFASEFGEYRYSKYIGLQQQLQYQRMRAIRMNRLQKSPTRNIRYPSPNNPYPNIQRTSQRPIPTSVRYSARYYQSL